MALGSDFDGFMTLPRGLRDAADLPRLTELLWRRGWREPRLGKLLGGNALRYLSRRPEVKAASPSCAPPDAFPPLPTRRVPPSIAAPGAAPLDGQVGRWMQNQR